MGKRHSRVPLSHTVVWRYKIEELNIPAPKEQITIQEGTTYVIEKKTHFPRQHKAAMQGCEI